jgi:GT2 family glycosyltransferase
VNDSSRVLIITVTFQNADCTRQFLESVSRLEEFASCRILIVDNNSDDGSLPTIRPAISAYENVELAASQQNRGYFGGAKWALDQYLTRHTAPDWVIVCNNDIDFHDRQFLVKLLRIDPTTVGMIAPEIVSRLTGYDANPGIRNRPSAFRMLRYRAWYSSYHAMWVKQWLWPVVRRVRRRFQSQGQASANSTPAEIYAPHGSFMIFSRRFFECGGFLDDGSFLYCEELLVAEMCRRLGLPIVHQTALRVWHEEGQTLGRMLTRKTFRHQKDGFLYALTRYNNFYRELDHPPSNIKPQRIVDTRDAARFRGIGDGTR